MLFINPSFICLGKRCVFHLPKFLMILCFLLVSLNSHFANVTTHRDVDILSQDTCLANSLQIEYQWLVEKGQFRPAELALEEAQALYQKHQLWESYVDIFVQLSRLSDNIDFSTKAIYANQAIQAQKFDLCILDVMLPEVDGFTLAQEIRKRDLQVPILFLSAKSLKEDKIHGLRLGADDYITKPFSIEELLLKIEIFLHRSKFAPQQNVTQFKVGEYDFDYKNLSLMLEGNAKRLTQKEAELLKFFIEHKNQVVKRSTILKQLWGEDDYFLGRSLDVFISRLRKYLREDPRLRIENIHGVGFKFNSV